MIRERSTKKSRRTTLENFKFIINIIEQLHIKIFQY